MASADEAVAKEAIVAEHPAEGGTSPRSDGVCALAKIEGRESSAAAEHSRDVTRDDDTRVWTDLGVVPLPT